MQTAFFRRIRPAAARGSSSLLSACHSPQRAAVQRHACVRLLSTAPSTSSSETAVAEELLKNERGEVCTGVQARAASRAHTVPPILTVRTRALVLLPRAQLIKNWGTSVELPAVSKEQAQEAFLDTTSVSRALTPPVATAVAARDEMLHDRFNYVATHVTNAPEYTIMAGKAKVAPAAVGQGAFVLAGACVLAGAIATGVYIKTQWGVSSAKELGDRLREKGAVKREALERSNSAHLVRSVSAKADRTVKENVELVRRPSQQLGEHFNTSFKGVVKDAR